MKHIDESQASTIHNLLRQVGSSEAEFVADKPFGRLADMPESMYEEVESSLWAALEASLG